MIEGAIQPQGQETPQLTYIEQQRAKREERTAARTEKRELAGQKANERSANAANAFREGLRRLAQAGERAIGAVAATPARIEAARIDISDRVDAGITDLRVGIAETNSRMAQGIDRRIQNAVGAVEAWSLNRQAQGQQDRAARAREKIDPAKEKITKLDAKAIERMQKLENQIKRLRAQQEAIASQNAEQVDALQANIQEYETTANEAYDAAKALRTEADTRRNNGKGLGRLRGFLRSALS